VSTNELLPRERVLEVLALREPDRVPWVKLETQNKEERKWRQQMQNF
jgi:hypothetical protein